MLLRSLSKYVTRLLISFKSSVLIITLPIRPLWPRVFIIINFNHIKYIFTSWSKGECKCDEMSLILSHFTFVITKSFFKTLVYLSIILSLVLSICYHWKLDRLTQRLPYSKLSADFFRNAWFYLFFFFCFKVSFDGKLRIR